MQSKCPKCNSTKFEIVEASIQNSKFKQWFIQCASCGCVVGTTEYDNIGALIRRLARKMNINMDSNI